METTETSIDMTVERAWADTVYARFALALQELLAQLDAPQLVVALGGGADSQTCLDLLDRFRHQHAADAGMQYLGIHLDHHFHPDSSDWAQVLREDLQRRQFPYHIEDLQVVTLARQSKEATGRAARYQRLAELVEPKALVLLGQHRNDQIETFLLQLKRGAGPKGLASMAELAPLAPASWLWRPLLNLSKADILRYAKARELVWIEDETNYDTQIERNFLRHQVVPLLEQRWPQFGDSVLRSAALCAEQEQVLQELLRDHLQAHMNAAGQLEIAPLTQHSEAFQRALLRAWLQHQGASMPSAAQLEQLRLQMLYTTNDAKPVVEWAQFRVWRTRQRYLVLDARP